MTALEVLRSAVRDFEANGSGADLDAETAMAIREVLAMREAVLALHKPYMIGHERFCDLCGEGAIRWPCPTVRALEGKTGKATPRPFSP